MVSVNFGLYMNIAFCAFGLKPLDSISKVSISKRFDFSSNSSLRLKVHTLIRYSTGVYSGSKSSKKWAQRGE